MNNPTVRRVRVLACVLVALAGPATRAPAQVIDRARRPVAPPEAAFKFPNVRMPTVLANGLQLYVVEDHAVPVVAVRVVMSADSTFDPPGRAGLYDVTLGTLLEGTTTRNADQFAAAAADIGTDVRPTGFTTTPALFPRALELLADMLIHPTLDSAAVERRKSIQIGAVRRAAQNPVTAPRRLFYSLLYGADDPFARSLAPSEGSVTSITRADVAAFYVANVRPGTTSIVITGDVSTAEALATARGAFESWPSGGRAVEGPSSASTVGARPTTIYIYDVPGAQTYLYVGAAGPPRTSPESYAADVTSAVATVRLQRELRERRSFMYSGVIGFTWRRGTRASTFVGSTVVAAQKVDSALIEWLSMLRGLRGVEPISSDELAAARRSRIGSLAAGIDGPDLVAARLVEVFRDSLPLDYFDRYAARASSVTAADLTATAARVIDMEHLVVVVAGDRKVIEPALRAANLAPVVIVDSSGHPVAP